MARRRGRTRRGGINLSTAVLAVGGLAALAVIVHRVSAKNEVMVNAEVYTKGSCATNPQQDDPNDDHVFTHDVVWEYTETRDGEFYPFRKEQGRVATVQITAKSGSLGSAKVNFKNPLVPLPADVLAATNGDAMDWTDTVCLSPYYHMCSSNRKKPFQRDACCNVFGQIMPDKPITITKSLIYRVLEDSCLDCRYQSCQPLGHTIPKGGGICAPFKYVRSDGNCTSPSSSRCHEKIPYNPRGGCNYQDIYGPYTGKCYILIR